MKTLLWRGLILIAAATLTSACGVPLPGVGGPSGPCYVNADCTDPTEPNCNADGRCFGPCASNTDCLNPEFPNCDTDSGLCQGPCPDPECPASQPVCDPSTNLCQGSCPTTACPAALPNCDPTAGACVGSCSAHTDCPDPAAPVCNPTTGVCQGPCPATACPSALPNCDPATSLCVGACADHADCPDPALPVCDPTSGVCQGDCPTTTCPAALPNCDPANNLCVGLCADHTDCPDPTMPNCDPATGVCQGDCPTTACPTSLPNCDPATSLCVGLCTTHADCPDPTLPNCDPGTGVCQGLCPTIPCPADLPNCDPATNLCEGPCADSLGCPDATAPNCDPTSGVCLGLCSDNSGCLDPALPNCGSDGFCFGACGTNPDCTNPTFPNCHPTPGTCEAACTGDGDCPAEFWKCDTGTGLCFLPECTDDTGCSPPTTVCESWFCVPGCTTHAECPAAERCDLVDAANLYHCETRDCSSDADCSGATPVCDTDGLVEADGGGYCEAACALYYDCRALGYDCDTGPTPAQCVAHDYGDTSADCAAGCDSGLCLTAEGNVCSSFCCVQHDCPDGYGCRAYLDGTSDPAGDHTIDVCVPLPATQGTLRYGDNCGDDSECRSDICTGGICAETCCGDSDCDQPFITNTFCGPGANGHPTHCRGKWTGNDPVGTIGCQTGGGTDCSAALCYSLYTPNTGCVDASDCTPDRPNCFDLFGDSNNDCVHDFCTGHCCNVDDCPDNAGNQYFCGKWLYSGGYDYDLCLLHEGAATAAEGDFCATDGECRSNLCSDNYGFCRRRCCTDADCNDPARPRCGLETDSIYGVPRPLNVCLPQVGACEAHFDCTDIASPNCDPLSGVCQGPCPGTPCPSTFPNCNPGTNLCDGPCADNGDCPDPSFPNCDPASGVCQPLCSTNADCLDPTLPNCGPAGICFGPCTDNADCTNPAFPNCHPTPGTCEAACTGDGDCPAEFWKCDTGSGFCFLPECVDDTGCSPPTTVCENWFCVPGCVNHVDCAATERCDLVDAGNINHCEPRDCLSDGDCSGGTPVCDTDSLVDPVGGGYCEPACTSDYDCRSLGYACDTGPTPAECVAKTYGDVGVDCGGGCDSGFCLTALGNLCTEFCCAQNDCPPGWTCQPYDDGTGGNNTVDVCQPQGPTDGELRYNEVCGGDSECRSGICLGGRCKETCCLDADCAHPSLSDYFCRLANGTHPTHCNSFPSGLAGVGELGCMSGTTNCQSSLCFALFDPDIGCVDNTGCVDPARPNCFDIGGGPANDCIHDMCSGHCCSVDDCPDNAGDIYFCGKVVYGTARDYNLCLLHEGAATDAEGDACATNAECRSNVCSDSAGLCRRRCCTDADCTNPTFPNCGIELDDILGSLPQRWINVCVP